MESDLYPEERQVQKILSESIRTLCKNAVNYKHCLSIDGLVGIRVDNRKVLLVKIQNVLQSIECAVSQEGEMQHLSRSQRKRRANTCDDDDDEDLKGKKLAYSSVVGSDPPCNSLSEQYAVDEGDDHEGDDHDDDLDEDDHNDDHDEKGDNPEVKVKEEYCLGGPIDDTPHCSGLLERHYSGPAGNRGLPSCRPIPQMTASNRKRRGYYTMPFKVEVIQYAKEHNKEQAARKYGIDNKSVRTWCQKEPEILKMVQENSTRCRLAGGGAKTRHGNLEKRLLQWIREQHRSGAGVSRSAIRSKALDLYHDGVLSEADLRSPFRASKGWLHKFLIRHKTCPELQSGLDVEDEESAS